jgi:hypothetical protein
MNAPRHSCGAPADLALINGVLRTCRGLSRSELADSICELLDWERANDRLKKGDCLELIDLLEADGLASPPACRNRRRFGPLPPADDCVLSASVRDFVLKIRLGLLIDGGLRINSEVDVG